MAHCIISPPVALRYEFTQSHQLLPVPFSSVALCHGKIAHVRLPFSYWLLGRKRGGKSRRVHAPTKKELYKRFQDDARFFPDAAYVCIALSLRRYNETMRDKKQVAAEERHGQRQNVH